MISSEILIRLVISLLLGLFVGFEREWVGKPAGLRTHALVCVGATLFTLSSIFYFRMDPARIAAGIVEGVGFIGAGTIIASKKNVKGITTAASLWAAASIGLAVGVGYYTLAIAASFIVFMVLRLGEVEQFLESQK